MDQSPISDANLLRNYARSADVGAFAELVRRYAGMVFSTARRVTGSAAAADDVSQDCFLKLAQRSEQISDSLGGWLHRATVNRALELRRAEGSRRRRESAAAAANLIHGTDDRGESARLIARVDEALVALPAEHRLLITEHFLCCRTQADIAAQLGVNQSTVQRRLDTALQALRSQLRNEEPDGLLAALPVVLAEFRSDAAPLPLQRSLIKIGLSGTNGRSRSIPSAAHHSAGRKLVATVAACSLAAGGIALIAAELRSPASTDSITTDSMITVDQLPPAVWRTVQIRTPIESILEVEQKFDGRRRVYEVEYMRGGIRHEIRLDENGTVIWEKP